MCAFYVDQTVQAQTAEKLYTCISTRRVHVSSIAPGHPTSSLGCPLFNFPSMESKRILPTQATITRCFQFIDYLITRQWVDLDDISVVI